MTSEMTREAPRRAGRRRVLAPFVVLALALSLTACGSSPGDRPTSEQQSGAFPISVTHAHGETIIQSTPERVVVLGASAEDAVAALGVVPVAVPKEYGTPDGYSDWFREHVTVELGAELPPILSPGKDGAYDPEEILSYAPDLIFAPYSGSPNPTISGSVKSPRRSPMRAHRGLTVRGQTSSSSQAPRWDALSRLRN